MLSVTLLCCWSFTSIPFCHLPGSRLSLDMGHFDQCRLTPFRRRCRSAHCWCLALLLERDQLNFAVSVCPSCPQSMAQLCARGISWPTLKGIGLDSKQSHSIPVVMSNCFQVVDAQLRYTHMYGLQRKFCHNSCRRLRPIPSRSVTLCKVHFFEIEPRWIFIPLSLPFSPRRELRDKFVASLYIHDVRRDMDSSLSRSFESIMAGSESTTCTEF